MIRAARYRASGDCIHADPLAVISPSGRTFSVYASDGIETNGIVSAEVNGLVFYDNDREIFLNRPLFTDILSAAMTPKQHAIVNEFKGIMTWRALRHFFIKLDKSIILEQFKKYLDDPDADRAQHLFLARANAFCEDEGISLPPDNLRGPSGFDKLATAIATISILRRGILCDAIPDIRQEAPDPMLAKSRERLRAERWLNLSKQKDAQAKAGHQAGTIKEVVAKYMSEVEQWENSIVMTLESGDMSRRDAEDYLIGSQTAYCPSPLGFTPRLRHAFNAPESLADEPQAVKVAFISALEGKVAHALGFPVKILYLPERHTILLESIGDGGREISLAYADGQDFEHGVLNAADWQLVSMVDAVHETKTATAPEIAEEAIQEARDFVDRHREDMARERMDEEARETGETGMADVFDEAPEQEM
jgi:hypothetical protein